MQSNDNEKTVGHTGIACVCLTSCRYRTRIPSGFSRGECQYWDDKNRCFDYPRVNFFELLEEMAGV